MCGGTPSFGAPMALPPAPPPPPKEVDPEVQEARRRARVQAAGRQGYASTIKTGGQGLEAAPPPNTTKDILGA